MRIGVFPNSLALGGSQLNAVELAEQMRHRGHHVVVFGPPGPLARRVVESDLIYEPGPSRPRVRPSPKVMRDLWSVFYRHNLDVLHGYEWPPILEACYGPGLLGGLPIVGTVMSMGVAPFIPAHIPLIVGTHQIAHAERHRQVVHVIEPPVDVRANSKDLSLPDVRTGLLGERDDLLVVVISRLAHQLKLEGILTAVDVIGRLASGGEHVQLVIVGDGPARGHVDAAAAAANLAAGRQVVTMVGSVDDPRPWYEAADVTFGMGGSAIRAMAFSKPLIVQGEQGFWRTLAPNSLESFLYQGWYGIGDGGEGSFEENLLPLLRDPALRGFLGDFGRQAVVERFSLDAAADVLERIYQQTIDSSPSSAGRPRPRRDLARPAAHVIAYELRRRYDRIRGNVAEDDFNNVAAGQALPVGRTN